MTEHKFAVGDVVQLKSGGPPMTVGSLPTERDPPYGGRVEVVFARNGRLRFDAVAPGALELVAEAEASGKKDDTIKGLRLGVGRENEAAAVAPLQD